MKEEKSHTHKHHEQSKSSNPNTKLWIMAIALALLIAISGVQAMQLVGLKNKLNQDLTEITGSSTSKTVVSTGDNSNTLNNNLNNLPSMVGGC